MPGIEPRGIVNHSVNYWWRARGEDIQDRRSRETTDGNKQEYNN
jgi:hypothetical protein